MTDEKSIDNVTIQDDNEDPPVPIEIRELGELELFDTHEKFSERLSEIEFTTFSKYVIAREKKDFSKQVSLLDVLQNTSKIPSICWEFNSDIEFDGLPYIFLGRCDYHCHQGKDKDVSKKEKFRLQQEEKLANSLKPVKKRKPPPPSKKVGCPVKFQVKKIIKFLDFDISMNPTRAKRQSTSKKLKDALNNYKENQECDIRYKLVYLTRFPKGRHEYHEPLEETNIISLSDPQLEQHINSLIQMGSQKPKKSIKPKRCGLPRQKSLLCKNLKVLEGLCNSMIDDTLIVQETNEKVVEIIRFVRNVTREDISSKAVDHSPNKKKKKTKDSNIENLIATSVISNL